VTQQESEPAMQITPEEYKRLFWQTLMLIGNICSRQSFTTKGVNNLFTTHGAEEGWRIKASFPDIRASTAMLQVNNWMRGIHEYQPGRTLPIARDILASLADSGSIVAHQDRVTAARLVERIDQAMGRIPKSGTSQQHQKVIDTAASLFASGHYSRAVQRAYEALMAAVREKAERPDLEGRNLMFQVFSEVTPILRISQDVAVQEGYKFLFAGAIGAIRNTQTHTAKENLSANEAVEMLTVCSYLFRVLDNATKVETS
jgi:uncharacterized protein (TIGR02391 family)